MSSGLDAKILFEKSGTLQNVAKDILGPELQKKLADAWLAKATPEQHQNSIKFLAWLLNQGELAKRSTFTTLQ